MYKCWQSLCNAYSSSGLVGQCFAILMLMLCSPFASADLEPVRLQLHWNHQFQFAGYYAAKEQGYYAEEGLDVDIISGLDRTNAEITNPIEEVVFGRAEFGTTRSDILIHHANGVPVKVIANILQRSPGVLLTTAQSGITSLADIEDKPISLTLQSNSRNGRVYADILAALKFAGINPESLNNRLPSFDLGDLISGKSSLMYGYATAGPFEIENRGGTPRVIDLNDYGIDFFGDLIFTSQALTEASPDLIARFLEATKRGWDYALDHPHEMIDLILDKYPPEGSRNTREFLRFEAEAIRPYIGADIVPVGFVNRDRWQQVAEHYQDLGIINRYDLDQLLYQPDNGVVLSTEQKAYLMLAVLLLFMLVGWAFLQRQNNRKLSAEISLRETAENALLSAVEHSMMVLSAAEEGIFGVDTAGRLVFVNDAAVALLDYPRDELLGTDVSSLVHEPGKDILDNDESPILRTCRTGIISDVQEARFRTREGHPIYVDYVAKPFRKSGQLKGAVVAFNDISQRIETETAVELASSIYATTSDAMMIVSIENGVLDTNSAFQKTTGFTLDDVRGQHFDFLLALSNPQELANRQLAAIKDKGEWFGEVFLNRKDGSNFCARVSITAIADNRGSLQRIVVLFADLTSLKAAERLIWQQANYDELTGLPNRNMFTERLHQEMESANRNKERLAVIIIDLDNFKQINDALGHSKGDALLVDVASRLTSEIRKCDAVARLGGDEFILLLTDLERGHNVDRVASNICSALEQEYQLGLRRAYLSASLGITFFPDDGTTVQQLLMNADQAMYHAKKAGRNRFQYYTYEMQQVSQRNLRLYTDLRAALAKNQILVEFQPIVCLNTQRVIKAEALVRWQHAELGLISPMEFIPIAEESGLIIPIGDWIAKYALNKALGWRRKVADFQVSVNTSPVQYRSKKEVLSWLEEVRQWQESPDVLALEITESLLMESGADTQGFIRSMRNHGVSISIDDFGTGYSSLAYLKKFDIDYIKIDRSFVSGLEKDSSDHVMCEAIVIMAHKLGMKVIAEGIETEEQRAILQAIGCDFGQGYYLGRPCPADAFESQWITQTNAGRDDPPGPVIKLIN